MTAPPRRVALLFGTRPEAIKLAPLIRVLRERADVTPIVVSTGQHREMLDSVTALFDIAPDRELSVMRADQSLAGLTARVVEACDAALAELAPDCLVVQGDTTTAFAAALAAFYRRIPVAHVEAGLRTGRLDSPFPEEANRQMLARLAHWHFAPTAGAATNLLAEGIEAARVHVTGNTVIDALLLEAARQEDRADAASEASERAIAAATGVPIERVRAGELPPLVLVTAHRRENIGRGFEGICTAIRTLAERHPEHLFVYPVHLNPRVLGPVRAALAGIDNVRLIAPQPYRPFVALMRAARLILSDSGGVQEEAPSLGVPVLVMRDTTERPEGVSAGVVRLVGTDPARIVAEASGLLEDADAHARMSRAANPYGDGRAAARIADVLLGTD